MNGVCRVLCLGCCMALAARRDLRLGLSVDWADWTLQLAWLAAPETRLVAACDGPSKARTPRALLLSASCAF